LEKKSVPAALRGWSADLLSDWMLNEFLPSAKSSSGHCFYQYLLFFVLTLYPQFEVKRRFKAGWLIVVFTLCHDKILQAASLRWPKTTHWMLLWGELSQINPIANLGSLADLHVFCGRQR